MSVQKSTDVGGPDGQRTRIPHGNRRAKLQDYIGQVFECKADGLHYYSRKFLAMISDEMSVDCNISTLTGPACAHPLPSVVDHALQHTEISSSYSSVSSGNEGRIIGGKRRKQQELWAAGDFVRVRVVIQVLTNVRARVTEIQILDQKRSPWAGLGLRPS